MAISEQELETLIKYASGHYIKKFQLSVSHKYADDIRSEVAFAAAKALATYDENHASNCSIKTWINRVIENQMKDYGAALHRHNMT